MHLVVGSYGIKHSPAATPAGAVQARSSTEGLWSHVTFDGGQTWRAGRLPGGQTEAPIHPLFPFNAFVHANLKILPNGTVVYAGVAITGHDGEAGPANVFTFADTHIFIARSFDGGLTWPDVRIMSRGVGQNVYALGNWAGTPQIFNNYPSLALGADGTLFLSWVQAFFPDPRARYYEQVNVVGAVSTDGGNVWKATSPVAEGFFVSPSTAVSPHGTLHVAYMDDAYKAIHARSSDGGATWKATNIGFKGLGYQLVVSSNGELFLAATERDSEGVERPILLRSWDDGATWSSPIVLDEAEAPGLALPAVAVDGRGAAYVSFYHPLPEAGKNDLRTVRVDDAFNDGTASLRPFVALGLYHKASSYQGGKGDYMGIAGLPEGAFAVWVNGDSVLGEIRGSRVV